MTPTNWVKVTRIEGGPGATVYVNLAQAFALTWAGDRTRIEFTLPPAVMSGPPFAPRIEVTETPEDVLAQLAG